MIDRDKIVTNGCIGSCCSSFLLPISYEDFKNLLKEDIKRLKNPKRKPKTVQCFNGVKLNPATHDEMVKLNEMLIPLGTTTISPEQNISYDEIIKEYKKNGLEESILQLRQRTGIDENGNTFAHIYTCKHFDAENKICTNYDNRPNMCRSFGRKCNYQGCSYKC